jgi:hypothetical protein
MNETDNSKYEELVGKYIEYREKEKINKDMKDMISNEIDELMHLEEINYKNVFITACDESYECKYIDRTVKKVDYMKLAEIVSDELYNQIITESTSTYLKIGPEAKKKIKKERPVPKTQDLKPSNIPKAKTK